MQSRSLRLQGLLAWRVALDEAASAARVCGGAGCQNGDCSAGAEGFPAGGRTCRARRRGFWVCSACADRLQVWCAIFDWEDQLDPFVREVYNQLKGRCRMGRRGR